MICLTQKGFCASIQRAAVLEYTKGYQSVNSPDGFGMIALGSYAAQYLYLERLRDGSASKVGILAEAMNIFNRRHLKRLEVIAHPADLIRRCVHSG
jgi:hypothetical protein